MENKKKTNLIKEEVKIVSRTSNEELPDEMVDKLKKNSNSAKATKLKKNDGFGEGVED